LHPRLPSNQILISPRHYQRGLAYCRDYHNVNATRIRQEHLSFMYLFRRKTKTSVVAHVLADFNTLPHREPVV
jgi:hypothetical protein